MTSPMIRTPHESRNYYISFYIRGRHYMISTITSTQVNKQISPTVRKNMTHLFIYRLRNYGDLEAIVEELNAIYDKKTRLQIYHEAVSEEYSFLYVNLIQKYTRKMFMTRFQHYVNPNYNFLFYHIIHNDDTY